MSGRRTDNTIGGFRVNRAPQARPQPYSWWDRQARLRDGQPCSKCGNVCTRGLYVTASMIHDNAPRECAVVNNCVICGTENVIVWGVGGEPYTWHQTHTRNGRHT